MSFYDDTTSVIKRAVDLLFIKNPTGTSMGVFLGIVLHWLTMLFLPKIESWSIINTNALRLEYFIPLGIFLFNIKPAIIDEKTYDFEYEVELNKIQKALKNGLISKAEAKLQFTNLLRSSIKNHCNKNNPHISLE